jgi:hypothetical protein
MGFVRKKRGNDRVPKPPRAGGVTLADQPKSHPTPVRVETSIGTVALFPQRFEDIGAFSKLPLDESSSTRLRLYLPYIAARSDARVEDGEWPRIDEASSRQLPDEDLERIAEAYLSIPERQQIADSAGPPSNPIARADGESATAYLDRLLRANHERQMEDLKGTYESLHNKPGQPLSSALADVDKQASSLRDVATSSMQGQNPAEQEGRTDLGANAIPESLESNRPLLISDAGTTENDGLKRARDEEMALTRSIGTVTTQSAILVANLSETTTRFLQQFAETTRASEEAARKSMRTMLIIVVAIGVFAAIAAAVSIVSYLDARESRQATIQWQESVLRSMQETAAAQAAQIKSLDDKIRELSDRQNALATAPPPAPATDAAAQKAAGEAEAPVQDLPKSTSSTSSKRAGKRKATR